MRRPTQQNNSPATMKIPSGRGGTMLVAFLAMAGIGVVAGAYLLMHTMVVGTARQNTSLAAQAESLKKQIKQQRDTNSGAVSTADDYKDPKGGLGLIDSSVTFTMPDGWVRVPADDCVGGTRDSTALCIDTAAISPSSLIRADGNGWKVIIGVFDYTANDGDAKAWFEEKYYGGSTIASYITPKATNISTAPVNGYSALSFLNMSGSETPDYVDAFYCVVHGKYAVVVRTQIQYGGTYGTYEGAKPYDYRQQYLPVIQRFMQSIRFKD